MRLLNRRFGILVTTCYLTDQAYQEIRDYGPPIAVLHRQAITPDQVDILFRFPS